MRGSRSIAKAAALFMAGLLSGIGIATVWTMGRPVSPLSADLPSDWREASAAFDRRIRIRFPAGTPIDRLANALDAEGFAPT